MPTLAQILEVLDRDEALEVGAAPDIWPTLDPDDAVYELDWARLFPGRVLDRGQEDWDHYGNDDWSLPPEVLQQFEEGSRSAEPDRSPPGWDRCAWYQPIHF